MNIRSRDYVKAIREAKKHEGIARVSLQAGAASIGRVQTFDDGWPVVILATCGHCGRSWNDALITGVTPAPSARCPFESKHR